MKKINQKWKKLPNNKEKLQIIFSNNYLIVLLISKAWGSLQLAHTKPILNNLSFLTTLNHLNNFKLVNLNLLHNNNFHKFKSFNQDLSNQFLKTKNFNQTNKVIYKSQVLKNQTKLTNIYKILIKYSTTLRSFYGFTHKSWRSYAIYPATQLQKSIFVNGIVRSWKNTYYLLLNLFYYNVPTLFFSNPFFKPEVDSLNWGFNSSMENGLRYFIPFIATNSNKISNENHGIFGRIKLRGISVAIVSDTFTHRNSLYYIGLYQMYSIGLVPVSYNPRVVNFPIVTGNPSFFNQLFFFRFVLVVKKDSLALNFKVYNGYWSVFTNTLLVNTPKHLN